MPNPSSKALPGAVGADAQPADLAEAGAGGGSGADLADMHSLPGHVPAAGATSFTLKGGIGQVPRAGLDTGLIVDWKPKGQAAEATAFPNVRHCNPLKQKPLIVTQVL